jgi:hypothetical protein
MLAEMNSHEERMYQLVTERMRAIGELQKAAEETRGLAIKNQASLDRLAAFDEAIHQLDNMRRDADKRRREIEAKRDSMRLKAEWVQPIINGFGYPGQFPKQPWDGFYALLSYLPAEQRKAIFDLSLTDDEIESPTVNPGREEPNDGARTGPMTLGQWLFDAAPRWNYPKQFTPLHNRFVDDVFPRITAALTVAEDQFNKALSAAFDEKMQTVQGLLKAEMNQASQT